MKIKIIIADDHPLLREAMKNTFEQSKDIEVVAEAGDGIEAIKLCSDHKPDVAVMDIVMPKMSGIEAIKEIKNVSPSTRVLILTAYDDDRYIIGLLESGAVGYLLKSAPGRDLVDAVRKVHAGESVLHPAIIAKLLKYSVQRLSVSSQQKVGEQLSNREMEVLNLTAKGLTNKDIARQLFVSERTVKAHMGSIFNKMEVSSRTEAIVKGIREGLITLEKKQDSKREDRIPG